MHRIFLAVLIMACTAHFSVAVEIPQPWNVVIESPDFLNASPEKQKQIRQQWEKDYRENEAINIVMMDLWNKHPELHTDTNEYFGFMARRDNYLHQGKPMSEALKLAADDTFQTSEKQDVFDEVDKQTGVTRPQKTSEEEVVGEKTNYFDKFDNQQKSKKAIAFWETTLEDCLLKNLKGVSSDAAARGIYYACKQKYPDDKK